MAYHPLNIAYYFVNKGVEFEHKVTPLQLLKLTYIAHGWHLGYFHKPLITDPVEAWQYGPVIPRIYHEFKAFGRNEIDPNSFIFELFDLDESRYPLKEKQTVRFLEFIWMNYYHLTGAHLIEITHREGTPWHKHYKEGQRSIIIPDSDIEAYYAGLIKSYQKQ